MYHSNDSQIVVVNHEFEMAVDGTIHETDSVRCTGLYGHIEAGCKIIPNIGSVNEAVVNSWWTVGGLLVSADVYKALEVS